MVVSPKNIRSLSLSASWTLFFDMKQAGCCTGHESHPWPSVVEFCGCLSQEYPLKCVPSMTFYGPGLGFEIRDNMHSITSKLDSTDLLPLCRPANPSRYAPPVYAANFLMAVTKVFISFKNSQVSFMVIFDTTWRSNFHKHYSEAKPFYVWKHKGFGGVIFHPVSA